MLTSMLSLFTVSKSWGHFASEVVCFLVRTFLPSSPPWPVTPGPEGCGPACDSVPSDWQAVVGVPTPQKVPVWVLGAQ